MDVIGQKVFHKIWGIGVVLEQLDTLVHVAFDGIEGIKKFQYPVAFKEFLAFCDPVMQDMVMNEIQKIEMRKTPILSRITIEKKENVSTAKQRKTRASRPNIAFKCNYCDGGKTPFSIGFNGVCSEKILRYNIDVEQRVWCCSEDCPCFEYRCGIITRRELENQLRDGGFVCYESQMLRDWKAMAGVVHHGERKGQPMRLMNVQSHSLCVLTTREPDSTEADRIIFAVFLIDDTYAGDGQEEGFVSTKSKFRLSLSATEARKMPFWKYHANGNNPKKEAWGTGLHRYLTDVQAVQILRDIAEIKRNTPDAKLAAEFLATFTTIVKISAEEAGTANGALTKE